MRDPNTKIGLAKAIAKFKKDLSKEFDKPTTSRGNARIETLRYCIANLEKIEV